MLPLSPRELQILVGALAIGVGSMWFWAWFVGWLDERRRQRERLQRAAELEYEAARIVDEWEPTRPT